ncbi:MAG: metal-dependent transcriptional regulator [Anaerotignum sp.]|nr:metal-dependent transcriptional regulator [Anaerotignum sp.]
MARNRMRIDMGRQTEENVLKTIKQVQLIKGDADVIDIANELNLNRSTAYSAVKRLVESGWLRPFDGRTGRHEKQVLVFTEDGEKKAAAILERHELILQWLIRLGVPREEAKEEACYMEHGLSDNMIEVLRAHVAMASKIVGFDGASASDIMEEMHKMMQKDTDVGSTLGEELQIVVKKAGGVEGIKRKTAFINQLGGEKNLVDMVKWVESLGGMEKISADLHTRDDFLQRVGGERRLELMIRFANRYKSVTRLEESLKSLVALDKWIEENSTKSKLLSAVKLIDEAGGEEALKTLMRAANQVGGAKKAAKILNAEHRLWAKEVFTGESNRQKMNSSDDVQ